MPQHPDKPGLEAANSAIGALAQQTNRGPVFMKQLEAAFGPLRPLLCQAESAAATFQLGRVEAPGAGPQAPSAEGRPGSAASKSSKGSSGSKKEKKKEDEPDGPDEGRASLYNGMAAYIRCIEMLRDPSQVKREEKLRIGGASGDESKAADGLSQKVGRIRTALALDVALALPQVLKQANLAMGFDEGGSLPEQAERLVQALGLQ